MRHCDARLLRDGATYPCQLPRHSGIDHDFGVEPGVTPSQELAAWWRSVAEAEIGQTVDKAIEYGSDDLIEIGRELCLAFGREVPSDEECTELGIFFYEVGKFARWRSAVRRGERPSDDTLKDIGVYVRMAQRNRDFGGWPS